MRLTKNILEAIILMACQTEAGGTDEVQGISDLEEQEKMFGFCLDAKTWAMEELERRKKS